MGPRTTRVLLACTLAACGQPSEHPPSVDASTDVDASPDAGPTRVPVQMFVYDEEAHTFAQTPRANIAVYFYTRDGELVTSARTGADGVARGMTEPGGSVAAVIERDALVHLVTDVQANDALQLRIDVVPPPWRTLQVHAPTHPQAEQHVLAGDGFARAVVRTDPQALDLKHGPSDLVVLALRAGASELELLGSIHQPHAEIVGDVVDLRDASFVPPATATWSFVNAPPASEYTVSVEHVLSTDPYSALFAWGESAITGPTGTFSRDRPVLQGARETSIWTVSQNGRHTFQAMEWGPAATAHELDLAPIVRAAEVSAPSFDPEARTIAWTVTDADANVARAYVDIYRLSAQQVRWNVTAPAPSGGAGALVLPQLPGEHAYLSPRPGDRAGSGSQLALVNVPGGYATLRQRHPTELAEMPTARPRGTVPALTQIAPTGRATYALFPIE